MVPAPVWANHAARHVKAPSFGIAHYLAINGVDNDGHRDAHKWSGEGRSAGRNLGIRQRRAESHSSAITSALSNLAHMPRGEEKLQKMARQSLLHELWQEQQRTHEVAVDWCVLLYVLY